MFLSSTMKTTWDSSLRTGPREEDSLSATIARTTRLTLAALIVIVIGSGVGVAVAGDLQPLLVGEMAALEIPEGTVHFSTGHRHVAAVGALKAARIDDKTVLEAILFRP